MAEEEKNSTHKNSCTEKKTRNDAYMRGKLNNETTVKS